MVQDFSFAGCAVADSYIVKLVGGSLRAQVLGAIFSITIPQGILEASGSMTTYSTTLWMVATCCFLLAWNKESSWLNAICIGLASGLALFAKGTSYIILPFIVLACWWMGSRASRTLFLKRALVLVALILAINGPLYLRNYEFVGSPLGVPLDYGEVQLTIKHIGVRSTAVNILRNVSLHTGTPQNFFSLEPSFRTAIKAIGVDPDAPDQILWGHSFRVHKLSFDEMVAGDPLQLILFLTALLILLAGSKRAENRGLVRYSLGLVSAFVALCALAAMVKPFSPANFCAWERTYRNDVSEVFSSNHGNGHCGFAS